MENYLFVIGLDGRNRIISQCLVGGFIHDYGLFNVMIGSYKKKS